MERSISRSFPLISANSGRALGWRWGLNGVWLKGFGAIISGFVGQVGGFGGVVFVRFGRPELQQDCHVATLLAMTEWGMFLAMTEWVGMR